MAEKVAHLQAQFDHIQARDHKRSRSGSGVRFKEILRGITDLNSNSSTSNSGGSTSVTTTATTSNRTSSVRFKNTKDAEVLTARANLLDTALSDLEHQICSIRLQMAGLFREHKERDHFHHKPRESSNSKSVPRPSSPPTITKTKSPSPKNSRTKSPPSRQLSPRKRYGSFDKFAALPVAVRDSKKRLSRSTSASSLSTVCLFSPSLLMCWLVTVCDNCVCVRACVVSTLYL